MWATVLSLVGVASEQNRDMLVVPVLLSSGLASLLLQIMSPERLF